MGLLAIAATSNFHVTLASPYYGAKGTKFGGVPMNLGGLKSKKLSSGYMQVKIKAQQAPSKINGTIVTTSIREDLVSRQNFSIKSYEIDADRKISIQALMNYFQETVIHHYKANRFHCDDFGSTPEMLKQNLICVTIRMKVVIYQYPTWGDDVQVETWISASGKIGLRMNWHLVDCKTGEILVRASSVCVMMNKLTRRVSKIPDEVRRELEPQFLSPLNLDDRKDLPRLHHNAADYISNSFSPRWSDLDVNQHVNNVKYIEWILESVPLSIMESHELSSMTLEYKRECGKKNKLQSLIAISSADEDGCNLGHNNGHLIECNHLLQLEDGVEIMRGKTEWRPKLVHNFDIMNLVM
ncbi:PREDICTED: palmitoyl-acyl carrier protein thioesterase, chloroplastic-like [Lupinus angustifolius]|nr:PREDICTED: palmitoyl-acyl carrier protein thioesterase, chloroplastic-like [Lupinus angustifolius]